MIPLIVASSGLYLWYRCLMSLLRRRHQIRENNFVLYYIGIILGFIGLLMDVLYNLTFGSLILLSLPRWGEWTLSQRLKRLHKQEPHDSYRYKIAKYICERILNPYDPSGEHC